MLLAALMVMGLGDDGLSEDRFRTLHEQLRPPAQEVWRSVPWKVSLVEAQNEAARLNKPLFIWSMDGNPLGCG